MPPNAYDMVLMIHVVPFMVDATPVIDRLAELAAGTQNCRQRTA